MARKPKKPIKMAKMCTGFQVRTPICHIVPVSRAYPCWRGGGGVATNSTQNTAKIVRQSCVLLLIRRDRKRVQKKV